MNTYFTTKITQQPNDKTHKVEGIMEGESLTLGVLGVGGRHGNVRERAAMPRRAEYSYSSSLVLFFHFDGHAK